MNINIYSYKTVNLSPHGMKRFVAQEDNKCMLY